KLFQFKLDYSQLVDILETFEGNMNLAALLIELDIAKLQVNFERLGKSTSADLAMRVSQEASLGSDPEVFAGVQITLPMYDNGKMDKRVQMAEKNVSILKSEVDRYKIGSSSELKLWKEEIENHKQKLFSIQKEIDNANEKVVELDKMLIAGKTSLMDIVNEKLNIASLETSKIDAVHAFRLTTLEILNSQTALCLAISACDEISLQSF
ncbi:MAG: TolC family protein, partial [Crocinitomicaceae bacterium]|nr:TolC family protein [Crocinitomicaceae bacterium]